MADKIIYADHAATTPVDSRVLDVMLPFLAKNYYNPSALYSQARSVRASIEKVRSLVLDFIGAVPAGQLIFTGSGTESVNLALYSAVSRENTAGGSKKGRIIVSAAEHHAVLNCAASLAEKFAIEQVPVDRYGIVLPETLKKLMGPDVCLVSIMSVNNETGAINDTISLCKIAHDGGARFHTDAVQALGVFPLRAKEMGADYISISAHKIYGPKGIGAMYAAPGIPIVPMIRGGKQEGDFRAGTENTAGIAGFGCAVDILNGQLDKDFAHLAGLRKIFLEGIANISDLMINSPPDGAPSSEAVPSSFAVPGIINISAAGVEAEHCLLRLSMAGVLASMGAACNAATVDPSHVVEAIGVPAAYKRGTLRFSFGRENTTDDAALAAQELAKAIEKTR